MTSTAKIEMVPFMEAKTAIALLFAEEEEQSQLCDIYFDIYDSVKATGAIHLKEFQNLFELVHSNDNFPGLQNIRKIGDDQVEILIFPYGWVLFDKEEGLKLINKHACDLAKELIAVMGVCVKKILEDDTD